MIKKKVGDSPERDRLPVYFESILGYLDWDVAAIQRQLKT